VGAEPQPPTRDLAEATIVAFLCAGIGVALVAWALAMFDGTKTWVEVVAFATLLPGIAMLVRSFFRAVRVYADPSADSGDGWTGLIMGSTVCVVVLFAWNVFVTLP
jgi:hypothetical protein